MLGQTWVKQVIIKVPPLLLTAFNNSNNKGTINESFDLLVELQEK